MSSGCTCSILQEALQAVHAGNEGLKDVQDQLSALQLTEAEGQAEVSSRYSDNSKCTITCSTSTSSGVRHILGWGMLCHLIRANLHQPPHQPGVLQPVKLAQPYDTIVAQVAGHGTYD